MKILTLIFTFTLIFQLKAHANTNISHAIAMHGEPKYSKDFENVEYINPNSIKGCLLYTSPSPRDPKTSRMPSSA